ncbi:GNAT family N-acetyltransferase [Solimonas sp. K1W22B-7]|uniref:GNAT family N-acetyltransferase n=1 Tax=Solimonas sp. K1W22B-7 TaxID=2303331 RepID=UPI001968DC0D|nr:GNAT family N-acetyltransferase [Solimonas sp. K1W22B-7]
MGRRCGGLRKNSTSPALILHGYGATLQVFCRDGKWFYFAEACMEVREALEVDAEAVSKLLNQLGYRASPKLIREKLEALNSSSCDAVLLAQDSDNILGVISLHVLELFHQPGRLGRITSLVIDDAFRRQGVGAMLVSAADAFFAEQRCVRAEVTSGDHRVQAMYFISSKAMSPTSVVS